MIALQAYLLGDILTGFVTFLGIVDFV